MPIVSNASNKQMNVGKMQMKRGLRQPPRGHLPLPTVTLIYQWRIKNTKELTWDSSLIMSLGAGALKVSGRPNAIGREDVSMATLEAGTTPGAATNQHCHTEWNSVEILMSYLREYLPEKIQSYETTQQGGRRESKNPQWFARRQKLMHYDQQAKLWCNATLAKEHTRSPAIPWGPPHRSQTGVREDRWPSHSNLTLPKWYLATSKPERVSKKQEAGGSRWRKGKKQQGNSKQARRAKLRGNGLNTHEKHDHLLTTGNLPVDYEYW